LSSANSNAVLIGAIAAAGLVAAEPLAAAQIHAENHPVVHGPAAAGLHTQALPQIAIDDGINSPGELLHQVQTLAKASSDTAPVDSDGQAKAQLDTAAHNQAPANSDRGTDVPLHNVVVDHVPLVAQGVAMPSAGMLMAAAHAAGPAQHNAVVEQVLADALNGASQGPDIDSLLGSLSTNPAGVPHGLGMLHAAADVGHFAAMATPQFAMAEPAMHHDAPPVS
jgi:hypothetical protein